MTDGPTQSQIEQVQANLAQMQHLNDYIFSYGQSKVLNAYLLLSETDNDPGFSLGLEILEGAFWAVGSEFGAIGNFLASFLSGIVSTWATNLPPSLNTTFASLETRLAKSSIALDTQLADLASDVARNWNTAFSYQGQTVTLSALADLIVPPETDPAFEAMANAALFALDQQIWATVLRANFVITTFGSYGTPYTVPGSADQPPYGWAQDFIKSNPSYTVSWQWYQSTACCQSDTDPSGWRITETNIGTGADGYHDGAMSPDACAYLFIDSIGGQVINPSGLYNRATVFANLGIRQTSESFPPSQAATLARPSKDYLRAVYEGRTLVDLIEQEGRAAIEARIIEKAQTDPVFALDVSRRPYQTLEKFLGVRIPEIMTISVILESARNVAIVVPSPAMPAKASTAEPVDI